MLGTNGYVEVRLRGRNVTDKLSAGTEKVPVRKWAAKARFNNFAYRAVTVSLMLWVTVPADAFTTT